MALAGCPLQTPDLPPSIIASRATLIAVINSEITPVIFINSGGAVSAGGWSVSPTLPAGLMIDANNGAISGTPTTATNVTDYSVTATNAAGSGTAIVTIEVIEPLAPPNLADRGTISVVQGAAISGASFVNSGGVPRTGGDPLVQGCRVTDGTLPSGLTLGIDGATCVISGTVSPSVPAGDTTITITARNNGGHGQCYCDHQGDGGAARPSRS